MQDFPAAHSMDTTWFAVDADGNIGLFDSSENGAIPESNQMVYQDARTKDINWEIYDIHDLFLEWSRKSSDRVVRIALTAENILRGLGIDWNTTESDMKTADRIYPKIILPSSTSTPWLDEGDTSNPKSSVFNGCADSHWLLLSCSNEARILEILKKNYSLKEEDYIVLFSGEPTLIFLRQCSLTTVRMLLSKGYLKLALPLEAYRDGLATLFGFFSYCSDYSSPLPYD